MSAVLGLRSIKWEDLLISVRGKLQQCIDTLSQEKNVIQIEYLKGLRSECHRRVKQRPRDRISQANRTSKEELEKLQKLLSTMKSQGWLPREGSVRQLLCADPSCEICNAMALEIQQLLGYENKKPSPVSLRPSQSSSCLGTSTALKVLFEKSQEPCSQDSRGPSLESGLTSLQLTDQKSSTQSAAPSTDDANVQYYCPDHHQKQGLQAPKVSQDADSSRSSSSLEESGAPEKQQKRRKNTNTTVLKEKDSEAEVENKMTFFSHWINPEVKCERQEEPTGPSEPLTVGKPRTEEAEQSQASIKDQVDRASTNKTTKHLKVQPLPTKKNI